jgi:hypothetical protein
MNADERFAVAIARIDAANAEDPNTEEHDGKAVPKELLYAERMTHWLARLAPNASEALRLAARSQHLRRWTSPRNSYPMDRIGYLKWRTDLKSFHAAEAGRILEDVGYDPQIISKVQSLLRKEHLKDDPDAQTLEDVACLVFLESYFSDFARKHDEEKMIGIIQKTWRKMSESGHAAALTLPLAPDDLALVQKALAE